MFRRRRHAYVPDPVKATDLNQPVQTAQAELVKTELQLSHIRMILKGSPAQLKWGTVAQVARSFRYQLNTYRRWLIFREQFLKTEKAMLKLVTDFSNNCIVSNGEYRITRQPHHTDDASIKGIQFTTGLPTPEQHAIVWQVHHDWYQLCLEVDIFYEQTKALLTLPDYKELKPRMPVNGRAAYSVLLACRHGHIDSNRPPQKSLFGWHGNYSEKAQPNLRKMARTIRASELEKRGPAPSFKTGCKILDSFTVSNLTPYEYQQPAVGHRTTSIIAWYSNRIFQRTLSGSTGGCTASMLKWLSQADQHDLTIRHRIAMKVMKIESPGSINTAEGQASGEPEIQIPPRCENNVLTALTGPVEHLYGDDYYAPAIYSEPYQDKNSPYPRSNKYRTVHGYVLFRRGWPDMVHCNQAEFTAATIGREYIGILDRASQSYFQRLRDEAEQKLTTKQRQARMLRQLRSLFLPIARTDSYKSGNCTPGTESFIQSLKTFSTTPAVMDDRTASIDGPELARCWRKAKYIQADRLANVIRTMLSKQAIQISLAFDAAAALFPAVDTISNELLTDPPIKFPLETTIRVSMEATITPSTDVEHDTRPTNAEREEAAASPAVILPVNSPSQTAPPSGSETHAGSFTPHDGSLVIA